jgi:hypothetical protein
LREFKMGKINFGRVLLGGLLAGFVMNIGEYILNEKVLAAFLREFMARHNFPAEPGVNFIFLAVGFTFLLSILMVWVYALIRPRLGPGVKSALVAAFVMWFGVYLYSSVFLVMLFGSPINPVAIGCVWGLVEYSLAAMAGGWLYREA